MVSNALKTARIAPVTGTGAVNGNFTIQRYIPNRHPSWSDFSSPTTASTVQDWANELFLVYAQAPSGNIGAYSEPLADYVTVNSGTTLKPGQGFEIYLSDDETLSTFTERTLTTVGVPNIGTQVIPILYTAANGIPYAVDPINGYAGENLVGNPFASTIDLSAIIFSPEVLPVVDVFDCTTQSYKTLSGNALIGPHQGFWAYTSGEASGTITIPESAKSPDMETGPQFSEKEEPFFQLTIRNTDNLFAQTLKIATDKDASDGWDKKDAPFRKSRNPLTPVIAGDVNIPVSIYTFNSDHSEYIMPLITNVNTSGPYEISAKGISYIDTKFPCIRLIDKLMNRTINLHEDDTYSFYGEPTDSYSRFEIHFSSDLTNCGAITTSIDENDFETATQVVQTRSGNIIHFNFSKSAPVHIYLTNSMGQLMVSKQTEVQQQSVTVNLPDDFQGVYFVRILSPEGGIIKKFYKQS